MQETAATLEKQIQRKVSDRWTPDLAAGGWLAVPNFFLNHYRDLKDPLSTHEFVLVLHVMRHKWSKDAPFPSAKRLARLMGISSTAVRNHLRSLEKKGYLRKVARSGRSNALDLTPLFSALEALMPLVNPPKEAREEEEVTATLG
jgi:DNA-binding MarR family transcriptional regulator